MVISEFNLILDETFCSTGSMLLTAPQGLTVVNFPISVTDKPAMWVWSTQIFTDHQHHSPSHCLLLLLSLLEDRRQRAAGRRAMLSQSWELLHTVALWGSRKQPRLSFHVNVHVFKDVVRDYILVFKLRGAEWDHSFQFVSRYLKWIFVFCKREI